MLLRNLARYPSLAPDETSRVPVPRLTRETRRSRAVGEYLAQMRTLVWTPHPSRSHIYWQWEACSEGVYQSIKSPCIQSSLLRINLKGRKLLRGRGARTDLSLLVGDHSLSCARSAGMDTPAYSCVPVAFASATLAPCWVLVLQKPLLECTPKRGNLWLQDSTLSGAVAFVAVRADRIPSGGDGKQTGTHRS